MAFNFEDVERANARSVLPVETTLTAVRCLEVDRQSVVVARFHADMSHPRFAEAFHRVLVELGEELL